MKGNLLEYRRILSGRIDIKKTDDILNFRGYLSLKKDPISEKIGHLNLIQKYSQIQFTDWLIGIVVLCGNDSYSFRQSSFKQKESQRRQPSFFQKKWNIQSIIQILMICFFSVIVIILRISMSCFKSLQFKGQMIPIAIDFIFTFPSYCNIINKLGFFVYAVVSNYLYHESKNGLQNQNFGLNFLNTFAEMSQSSHIIFNSLKIQNQKQKNISTICLKDNFFRMKDNYGVRDNEGQSNNNMKSNNTIIKTKPQYSITRTDIGDDISFNSPNSNNRILQNKLQSNGPSSYNDSPAINSVKTLGIPNFNPISLINEEDQGGKTQNTQNQLPTSGLGIHGLIKKQAAQWKHSLQKIIELDSKSVIPQYDNDAQDKDEQNQQESSIQLRKNSFQKFEKQLSSKQGTNRSIQKKESFSQYDDRTNNLQTFAENSDQENSIPIKIENHKTKRNVSITRLNIEQSPNMTYYENNLTSSHLVLATNRPKTIEDTDVSFINNVSHREFFQDGDNQNGNNLNNISQNNSPKSKRRLTKGTSEKTSQNIQSESKSLNNINNNNNDVDQVTFMKQSFAPANFYQQLQLVQQKSNGQQGEFSSPIRLFSSKPQIDTNQKNQQIVSFDNISLYEKDNQLKQEKKSPTKVYYQPYQNGSGHSMNFVSSPKWKPPSGTVTQFNYNGTNGQTQNTEQQYQTNELLTDNIQTEQSQQMNLKLSQSSSSLQNDSKNNQMKEQVQNEEMISKKTPTYTSFKPPSIFKTNQTGQVSKKSLIDDFDEYGLRSSSDDSNDDESSDENDADQRIETQGQSSNRNLILNTLNSHRLDTAPNQSSHNMKLEIPYEQKSIHKHFKKLNVVSSDTDQSLKNRNFNTNGLENVNLIYSEMDGSQNTSYNMQSQLDRFNQTSSNQRNVPHISIIDSCDFNSHDESTSNAYNNQDSKYQRMKRKKSLTNQIQKNNEKDNIQINFLQPDEGTPQHNNLNTSSDFNSQLKVAQNTIALNPKIQKLKQNATSTDDINSQESLQQQKRLTLSNMYPSANNIQKAFDIYKRRGSNINLLKRSIPAFDNSQSFNKQILEKNQSTREILFAMAICHDTKTKGDRLKIGKKVSSIHLRQDTAYILEFTKNHNVSFECSCTIQDQNYYIIKTDEGNEKVQILQKFITSCNKNLIVYAQHNDKNFMIIKSFSSTIPDYLVNSISTEKRQKFELLLSKVKQLGEKIIFYSKIQLNEQQSYEFQNSTRLETQQEKIEQIYNKFIKEKSEDENNPIQLLGFIGLQEESDMLMKGMVKELRRFGQKLWVLTSDSQSNTIESCYNYKILQDKGMDVLDFTGTNFDELFYKTRNHLQVLNKYFTQQPNNIGKESVQVTQSAMEQPIKDANSLQGIPTTAKNENQTPQTGERRPTIADYNQSFRKYLPPAYNQQPSQTQLNIGGTSKRVIQQFGSNPTKNVIQMEEDQVQEKNQEEELNYYVVLSGESLNVIRNNTYLWDHFCLIAFFAGGVIGYEMTDEQKSVLGQTITTRFHRSAQKVVNIVSSLNDVEKQNFDQISVYIGSTSDPLAEDKSIVVSQHPDIYTKDTMSFLNVLIRESKFQSEMIEETMYLAIHRSYLTALVIIFWNVWTCSCNYPLFTPYQQIFFHGFQYLTTIIYYIRRKREKFNSDKDSELSCSNFLYTYFADFKQQYNEQQIPILNLKIIISSIFDIILIFLFYTTLYDFEDGMQMDVGMLSYLIQWGIYIISFCRVFDLHFTKFDRYLVIYIITYVCIIIVEIAIFQESHTSIMLLNHTFKNGYILNSFLFICFFLAKSIFEGCLLNISPTSIVGLGKYIILSRKQAIEARKQKDQNTEINNKNKRRPSKFFENHFGEIDNRSPDKDEVKQDDMLSSNQTKRQGELLNNNMSFNKSENSSFNSFINPIFSSNILKNYKNKINPVRIIRSIFKDREMDIILSSMMQEEINLSQTQMSRFTLNFQIKEIEAIFLKGWELLIPYSNRIFYIFHFIVFDIGYDILVLSKVTNEFSAADGGYVMSYAITASAIFILTSLSLSKYYTKKNIVIISLIMVIVRSIKLILLSSFKQIIIYPTECIMHISIACSCLRFPHYLLFIQGILLFGFFIIITETSIKKWNLQTFLEAIGYSYEKNDGLSDSVFIIRTCFYISYFIILALFVSEKYNMILTIRKNYLSEHNLFKATIKVKDILSILLPKFIREKIETMKQGQYRVAEKQDEVVIVFCDICNFDDVIFNEKANTVRILDKLYRQFDLACQQNGLQKIETVGKTYLAAAGISNVESLLKAEGRLQDASPAKRALNFAFDLQRIVKSKYLYLACNKKIIIKVGIHLGPAISGVIGYHKPQFSLIGDTVNTTSRVCSTGLSDAITVSSEVYIKVHHQCALYKFQKRDVEAKGKGIMTTYQVFDKKTHRAKHVKKQTLNDTAMVNHNSLNTPPSMASNMPSFQQFDKGYNFQSGNNTQFMSNRMNTLNQLENSIENNDRMISDANMVNSTSKKNSSKQIPLQAIPESPSQPNASNTLIADIKLHYEKQEEQYVPRKVQTSHLLASSDKSQKDKRSPYQNIRNKQTSFGGVTDAITDEPLPINEERPRRRMVKKSSSFTIVDMKPRFQNIQEGSPFQRTGSGKEYIIEENFISPLMLSNNEFIKQLEKDLLMRIELEPENIILRELKLPLEKIQMHISQQDHPDKSIQNSKENSGSYSHLRMGICSSKGDSTAEQKQLHSEFQKSILKQQVQSILVWLLFISLYFMIKFIIIIISILMNSDKLRLEENNKHQLIVFSIIIFLIFLFLTFTFRKIQNTLSWRQMRFLLYFLYFISLIFSSLQDFQLDTYLNNIRQYNLPLFQQTDGKIKDSSKVQLDSVTQVILPSTIIFVLEIEFIFMFFTTLKSLYFLEKLGAYIAKIMGYFVYSIYKDEVDSVTLFFIFIVGVIHLRIQYHHMKNEVLNFNNLKTLEMKKEELDSLLKNLLPSHILEQFLNSMKKEIPLVCEELDDVTLLFADIAGFTKYSSTTDPIVVVNMLRKLFTDFDDHCLNQNVYKLYTIGDCYVCFGLNNKNDRHPAQEAHNVVRFAFDMIRIIENVRQYTNCNLQMRIGIHTGKLYGGIVGTEIVRYDIYGQDVIIANKMESNGESGHVMVSETTKKLLEDHFANEFIFDFKDSVHIKQINKNIDGFLIRFNENPSEYLENGEQSESNEEQNDELEQE